MQEIAKTNKKRCNCPQKKSMGRTCENCSRYKMVFLLKYYHHQHKVFDHQGKKVCPARYCFLRQNTRPIEVAMAEMLKRVVLNQNLKLLYQGSNIVRLYDRQTGTILDHKVN